MDLKKSSLVVNDLVEELNEENKRLLNELLFANKCLNILTEIKTFFDFVFNKIKPNLDENHCKTYEELCLKAEEVFDYHSIDSNSEVTINKKTNNGLKQRSRRNKIKIKSEDFYQINDRLPQNSETNDFEDNRWPKTSESVKRTTDIGNEGQQQLRQLSRLRSQKRKQYYDRRVKETALRLPKKDYICDIDDCGQSFPTYGSLYNHKLKSHKLERKTYLICDSLGCEQRFRRRDLLNHHMITTHPDYHPFKCGQCGKIFSTKGHLKSHLIEKHQPLDQPLVCDIDNCNKQFNNKVSFKRHQRDRHFLEKRFSCDHQNCNFKSKYKTQLKTHLSTHLDDRPFSCSFDCCQSRYKTKSSLKLHIKLSHEMTEYKIECTHEGCDSKFRCEVDLNRHIKHSHSITKPFRCDWPGCEYSTARPALLTQHSLVHSTEHTFPCIWPQCDKRFKTRAKMNAHLKIHKGDKRHACHWPGCQYRCIESGNLTKHMRKHKRIA